MIRLRLVERRAGALEVLAVRSRTNVVGSAGWTAVDTPWRAEGQPAPRAVMGEPLAQSGGAFGEVFPALGVRGDDGAGSGAKR
ncbi:hypothetical protein [Streptomyces sp.]